MKEYIQELVERWHSEGYGCFVAQMEDCEDSGTSRCFSTVSAALISKTLISVSKLLGSIPFCWDDPQDGYLVIKGEGGTEEMVMRIIPEIPGDAAIVAGFTDTQCSVAVRGPIPMSTYLACRTICIIDRKTQECKSPTKDGPFGPISLN